MFVAAVGASAAPAPGADQAERGRAAYRQFCSKCHAPAVFQGDEFRRDWGGRTAYELFESIRKTMPTENPGRLSRKRYAEITAYLLRLNGFALGPGVPEDEKGLRKFRIEAEGAK